MGVHGNPLHDLNFSVNLNLLQKNQVYFKKKKKTKMASGIMVERRGVNKDLH